MARRDTHPEPQQQWYRRRGLLVLLAVLGIPALALAWWLLSPLFLDKTVVEEFPRAARAQIPAGSSMEEVEEQMLSAEAEGATVADDMPEAEPVRLLSGALEGADSFHQGAGNVAIYELGDGSRLLRFEDLDVTNGPDLHVILSPVASAASRQDVMADGYIDLGGLKGNRGDQNYELPDGVDLEAGDWTVVIYCQPFHVIFATAALS